MLCIPSQLVAPLWSKLVALSGAFWYVLVLCVCVCLSVCAAAAVKIGYGMHPAMKAIHHITATDPDECIWGASSTLEHGTLCCVRVGHACEVQPHQGMRLGYQVWSTVRSHCTCGEHSTNLRPTIGTPTARPEWSRCTGTIGGHARKIPFCHSTQSNDAESPLARQFFSKLLCVLCGPEGTPIAESGHLVLKCGQDEQTGHVSSRICSFTVSVPSQFRSCL